LPHPISKHSKSRANDAVPDYLLDDDSCIKHRRRVGGWKVYGGSMVNAAGAIFWWEILVTWGEVATT